MHDEDINIVTVQETHAGYEENLRRRGTIPGYTLIGAVTYVEASFSNCRVLYQDHSHDVQTLAVEVDGTIVENVCRPPSASWSNVPLKLSPHPAIYVGDFNSQNQLWDYEHNDADGNRLLKWMTLNKLHLIYHPNDKGTFKSARWGKDYTPDLSIVTRGPVDNNTLCNLYIIESFLGSQHRPVLLHYGIRVPLTESIEKPGWNFSSVDFAFIILILFLNYNGCQCWRTSPH
jgi:hypothetical protein